MQRAIPFFRGMIQKTFTPRLKVIAGTFVVLLAGSVGLSAPTADKGLPPNVSSRLLSVVSELEAQRDPETKKPQWSISRQEVRVDGTGRLEVMIQTTETNPDVLKELEDRGLSIEIYDAAQNLVQAWAPTERIGEVSGLPFVRFLDLPGYGVANRPRE